MTDILQSNKPPKGIRTGKAESRGQHSNTKLRLYEILYTLNQGLGFSLFRGLGERYAAIQSALGIDIKELRFVLRKVE
jgi:hypothetical protein